MKRILLFAAALVAATGAARAQTLPAIPNGGFETWTGNLPGGWTTSDQLYASELPFPVPTNTVTRSTDKYNGQAAAQLQAFSFFGLALPPILILGTVRDLEADYPGGIAYAARPASMQFWYKFQGTSADSAAVSLALTRGGGTNRQEIGLGGAFVTGSTSTSYRLGQVPIIYNNALAPDSLYAFVTTNAASTTATLLLDDVVMSNTVTAAKEPMLAGALLAYPNPSTDGLFKLRAERDHDVVASSLTVTDALGRTVLRQPAVAAASVANGRPLDLRGQKAGVYVLRLESERGAVLRRLVVQ